MSLRLIKLVFLGLLVVGQISFADDMLLATIDYPPVAYHSDKVAMGFSVVVAREMGKLANVKLKDMLINPKRLLEVAESYNAIYAMVARIPEREDKFNWIGEIYTDEFCFISKKTSPGPKNTDEAKKLKSVGVTEGSTSEKDLANLDFKNVVKASGVTAHARKLKAGIIDAWYSGKITGEYSYKQVGGDPNEIQCTAPIKSTAFWIAASKKVSPSDLENLKKAYAKLTENGFIAKAKMNW